MFCIEKFECYMHTKKLRGQLFLTDTSIDDKKYIFLGKRSIMTFKSESRRNRPEAWKWSTAQISSSETPGVMNLVEQPTSLCPDLVTPTSAMIKSYQSLLNEWNCLIHLSLTVFVTFVLRTNWIVTRLTNVFEAAMKKFFWC